MIRLWHTETWRCLETLVAERPYERLNLYAADGLSEAQRVALQVLGAVE